MTQPLKTVWVLGCKLCGARGCSLSGTYGAAYHSRKEAREVCRALGKRAAIFRFVYRREPTP